jgi:hypothetical protein
VATATAVATWKAEHTSNYPDRDLVRAVHVSTAPTGGLMCSCQVPFAGYFWSSNKTIGQSIAGGVGYLLVRARETLP